MKAKKTVITVLSVILAVVLAYSAAAVVTLSSEYEGEPGFGAFSYALNRLFAGSVTSTFKKTAFNLFGAVLDKNVAKGGDGYLFPVKTDGFDYAADIAGKAHYDAETKKKFLDSLNIRRAALETDGCELYVFVIPNSQTVLRDKLKTKDKNGVTAAEDLEKYLRENGFDNFYLLSSALSDKEYDTYNNTENTVNGYGAYLICREIASRLPDAVSRRAYPISLDDGDVTVSYSDGGALAKQAEIEKLIKNKNVSYKAQKFTSRYTTEISGALTVCTLKDEYNGFIGRSVLLLQIPDNERTLFMPLFSASYTDTVYHNSLSYSAGAASLRPAADICILREDRLLSLLDEAETGTYRSHVENGDGEGVTAAPEITAVSVKQSGTAFVAGFCENGAEVTVSSGKGDVTVICENGLFIAELPAEKGGELSVSAVSGAKQRSDTVKCTVTSAASAQEGVYAGGASMLYYGETLNGYTGADLFDQKQLELLKKRFEAVIQKTRESSGKDTEIIFLTAPDPLSIYPEAASPDHGKRKADKTLFDQFAEALSSVDGLTFLDVRETMRQNTDIDRLYYQTDTHWTETGAYFGYRAVAEAAGQTPYPLNMFEPVEKTVPSGDLASFAGLTGLTETVRFLEPRYEQKAAGAADKPYTIDRSVYADEIETAVNDGSLPSAVMIRDSYSANLFPFICEHFSRLYCQRMWEYEPDYEKIAQIKPDYLIYVISERNLDGWK